jgi:hypothetical protein
MTSATNSAKSVVQVRLPNEILEMVFMNLLGDPTVHWHSWFRWKDVRRFVNNVRGSLPADFLLVCRQWTEVILHTRRLWTTILVDNWTIREQGPEVMLAKVKAHLQRSRNEPLDVIYAAVHDPSLPPLERETFGPGQLVVQRLQGLTDGSKASRLKQVGDLLSVLAGENGKEMKRWRSCILAWSAESRWAECWWMGDFLTYPTPLLESLCFWNFTSGEQPTFPDAPVLKRLVTTGYYLQIGTNVPLPCIESAEISEGTPDGNRYRYGRLAVNILRRVTEVRSLNILVVNGWRYSFVQGEQTLHFPNLIDLKLEGDVGMFLWKLRTPRLSSLTLHLDSGAGHEEMLEYLAQTDFPELSRLDLDLIKTDDPQWTLDEVESSVIRMLSTKETLRTVVGNADLEEVVRRWKKRTPSFLPRLVSLRVRDPLGSEIEDA